MAEKNQNTNTSKTQALYSYSKYRFILYAGLQPQATRHRYLWSFPQLFQLSFYTKILILL